MLLNFSLPISILFFFTLPSLYLGGWFAFWAYGLLLTTGSFTGAYGFLFTSLTGLSYYICGAYGLLVGAYGLLLATLGLTTAGLGSSAFGIPNGLVSFWGGYGSFDNLKTRGFTVSESFVGSITGSSFLNVGLYPPSLSPSVFFFIIILLGIIGLSSNTGYWTAGGWTVGWLLSSICSLLWLLLLLVGLLLNS